MDRERHWEFVRTTAYKNAKRRGRDAFGRWLTERAREAAAQGDEELEFFLWYELLTALVKLEEDTRSEIAARVADLRPPDGSLARYTASFLYEIHKKPVEALRIVHNGYAVLKTYDVPEDHLPFNRNVVADWCALARVEATILAATSPDSPRLVELLSILSYMAGSGPDLDEAFAGAIARLYESGRLARSFYPVVEWEWSRWARQEEFVGTGGDLAERLRKIVKRMRR